MKVTSTTVPAWLADAACKGMGAAVFFPAWGQRATEAKRVCGHCPVSGECLAAALAMGHQHGVWGGLTARERRRLAAA